MKAQPTNTHKTPHARRWKPLSQAQENALVLLLAGRSDADVGADPGVNVGRETVWAWRHEHPVFKAELQQRRAALYGAAFEQLRAHVSKAVEVIGAKVDSGDYDAALDLLKCVGIYGNGRLNAVHGLDAEKNLAEAIDQRIAAEQIPKNEHESMSMLLEYPTDAYRRRKAQIEAEFMQEYGEADQ